MPVRWGVPTAVAVVFMSIAFLGGGLGRMLQSLFG